MDELTVNLIVRITPQDRRRLNQVCRAARLTPSAWVRRVLGAALDEADRTVHVRLGRDHAAAVAGMLEAAGGTR
jgi:hypothetical protein